MWLTRGILRCPHLGANVWSPGRHCRVCDILISSITGWAALIARCRAEVWRVSRTVTCHEVTREPHHDTSPQPRPGRCGRERTVEVNTGTMKTGHPHPHMLLVLSFEASYVILNLTLILNKNFEKIRSSNSIENIIRRQYFNILGTMRYIIVLLWHFADKAHRDHTDWK